ncbi:MAG: hypothetical protein ACI97A_002873 [Planctomycetota bacterium]|jgi:hypothetical protein
MKLRSLHWAFGIVLIFSSTLALAQGPPGNRPRGPGKTQDWSQIDQRISWHGTWKAALATAKVTGQPILLISAAPSCGGVPGMW